MPTVKGEMKMMTPSEVAAQLAGNPIEQTEQSVPQTEQATSKINIPTEPDDPRLAKISIEDRREYIRSLLGKRAFKKTYKLFGDTLTVTFSTRTMQRKKDIDKAVKRDVVKLNIFDAAERTYKESTMTTEYKLMSSLCALEIKNVPTSPLTLDSKADSSGLVKFDSTQLDELSDITHSAIMAAFVQFEEMCDTLYEQAQNPDFWMQTGGRA